MGGGLMQLVAYGSQDVVLTSNAQITFWKASYKRYTNFALESIEQTFNGQADFGRRVTCTISRNGDLAFNTLLQVTLPQIGQELGNTTSSGTGPVYARWLDYPGEQIISQIEVEIGGQRIDRHYGDWMHIWNQLTMPAGHEKGYNTMVGNTTQLTYLTDPTFSDVDGPCQSEAPRQICAPRNALPESTLYIPLQFWFATNPGLALPLIALQYHEVRINIDFRPIDECLWAVSTLDSSNVPNTNIRCANAYHQSLVSASLYVDYVFLDTDERRRFAQNPHEYLIHQLQFTGDESLGSSSNKIKLSFNHPVKELIWVVQPDASVDYCSSFESGSILNRVLGAQPFNYTDAIDALPNAIHAFGGPSSIAGPGGASGSNNYDFINADGLFQSAGALDSADLSTNYPAMWGGGGDTDGLYTNPNFAPSGGDAMQSYVSDAGTFVLSETAMALHCWGSNPVVTAKLQLNGQDRFSEREGSYFDVVQPFQYHTRTPDTGINVYSFALRPEEHQPSGTCNFSRIDNSTLMLVLSNAAVTGSSTVKVRVYTTNYNVLRIMSGMGGLAYAN